MDGLGRAAGSPVVVRLGGRDYKMAALTLRDFGTIEQHLLARRPNILKVVAESCADLPPETAKVMMEKAYDDMKKGNTIPATEIAEWVDTFEGMVFSIWLSLQKEHAELSLDDVMTLMSAMSEEEVEGLKGLRDIASGLDEVGNSIGPVKA